MRGFDIIFNAKLKLRLSYLHFASSIRSVRGNNASNNNSCCYISKFTESASHPLLAGLQPGGSSGERGLERRKKDAKHSLGSPSKASP